METDFLLPPFLNPGVCHHVLEETPLPWPELCISCRCSACFIIRSLIIITQVARVCVCELAHNAHQEEYFVERGMISHT